MGCALAIAELVGLVAGLGLPAGSTALDLGCGTGAEAVFLARAGFTVVGVDLSRTALRLAREQASARVSWCQADVLALPVAAASMDLVTDRGCLHHLPVPHRRHYAGELGRVLRPGGWAFLRGMSEQGQRKIPVTPEVVASLFSSDDFDVTRSYDFTMVGANGHASGCLALLRRRHGR